MDKDGLELSSWQNSGVNFDLNNDGAKEQTGWISSSDNGDVDNIEELFGNASENGFIQLKEFDSNNK